METADQNGSRENNGSSSHGNGATAAVDNAIVVHDLRKRFGHQQVLDGVNLEVPGGFITCIVGPSGGGKTVLTPWVGLCNDYRDFGGVRIPAEIEVHWQLEQGDFSYARFRVTALEFNVPGRF